MKKIEAIIQNKKFLPLVEALRSAGISGMTASEVKGFGNEQTRPEPYLFLPKTKIEIYCNDDSLDNIIDIIVQVCKTGSLGDGKIAVYEIEDLVRIRTREHGVLAV